MAIKFTDEQRIEFLNKLIRAAYPNATDYFCHKIFHEQKYVCGINNHPFHELVIHKEIVDVLMSEAKEALK